MEIAGTKNCATLTNLEIRGWGYTKAHKAMNFPAFTLLTSAVNLESLCIDCRIHWDGPKGVARQIYRDGHHYLEAVGAAKGQYDAAIDIIDFRPANFDTYRRNGQVGAGERFEEYCEELRRLLRTH